MFTRKQIIAGVVTLLSIIVILVILIGCIGHNNFQNYQILQSPGGGKWVRNDGGYYGKMLGTKKWAYPKTIQVFFSEKTDEGGKKDQSIRGTFNDGGTAQVSTMVRFVLPTSDEQRLSLHEKFKGDEEAIIMAVRAHLTSCIKSTAPTMSATEHQAARKAEFQYLVSQQLRQGLFETKRVIKRVKVYDDISERDIGARTDGPLATATSMALRRGPQKEVELQATEIVLDEATGKPRVAEESPLTKYGFTIDQFSVTETEYDPKTREQFAAKKELFLAAEKSKAEREQEIQQRLMVIEKGLRERAEVEAVANKEKAKQVIDAEMKAEVAMQTKKEQTTLAEMKVQIAEQGKFAAEQEKLAAKEKAEGIKILAEAKEVEIAKAGVMKEVDKIPLEIKREIEIGIANALSKVNVPQTMIISGGGGGGGGHALENLINLYLLKNTNILPGGAGPVKAPVPAPQK